MQSVWVSQKTPRERDKKERKWWREREKKSEILGGLAEGGPAQGGTGGSETNNHTPTHQHTNTQHTTQHTTKQQHNDYNNTQQQHTTHNNNHNNNVTKMDWPKLIGPNWPNHKPLTRKIGQNWIGQSRPQPHPSGPHPSLLHPSGPLTHAIWPNSVWPNSVDKKLANQVWPNAVATVRTVSGFCGRGLLWCGWRVPHLTLLTCAVGSERCTRIHLTGDSS